MTALRLGSLCTGYGGLDAAVGQVLDVETVWHADPDPGATAILTHHWPHVPNLGDITATDWTQVPPVDVLTAGFPCQDVSLAGRRAGIADGTRSGLWAHVARAISVLQPRIVVIENVRGLLSASADGDVEPCTWCVGDAGGEPPLRALGAVLGDLARLGLDAQWASVRASDVGAPHQRERVFLLAWPADTPRPRLEARREGRPGGCPAADAAHLGHERAGDARDGRPGPADSGDAAADAPGDGRQQGRPEPARELGGSDVAERGNSAPSDADRDGLQGQRRDERPEPWGPTTPPFRRGPAGGGAAPTHTDRGGLAGDAERYVEAQHGVHRLNRMDAVGRGVQRPAPLDWGPYTAAIRRWEHVTGRPAPAPTEPGRTGNPRLSAEFLEWLMGLPAGHVTAVPGLTRTQQLRALGNGVVPQQGASAVRLLLERAELAAPLEVAA